MATLSAIEQASVNESVDGPESSDRKSTNPATAAITTNATTTMITAGSQFRRGGGGGLRRARESSRSAGSRDAASRDAPLRGGGGGPLGGFTPARAMPSSNIHPSSRC